MPTMYPDYILKLYAKAVAKAPAPSSSEDSSEDSDEEPPKAAQVKAAPAKAADSDSDDSDSSSEDEAPAKPVVPAAKKAAPKVASKAAPVVAKKADTSSESSSDDSDSESDEEPAKPVKAAPVAAKKAAAAAASSSSEEDSDDSSPAPKKAAAKAKDSSDDSDDSDSDSDVEMAAPSAPVANGKGMSILSVYLFPPFLFIHSSGNKRKADDDAPPTKKVKLANGEASAADNSTEETKSIFVGSLSWNVDNDRLAQEFAECGEVVSATVQVDRNSGRSRGFGYVHFATSEAVEAAIAMNGKEIDGRAVNIDKSTPRNQSAARENRANTFGDKQSPPSSVLFVGNLSFNVSEDQVWEAFSEHGDVKSVRLPTDRDSGRPKGFGYVEFSDIDSAKKAHSSMQGQDIDGRTLRLDFSQPRDNSGGDRGGFGGGRGGGRVSHQLPLKNFFG